MKQKIGILGGGQLGRMLALSSSTIEVDVKVIDESPKCSAAKVTETANIKYSDLDSIKKYFSDVDVVTYEFENIPQSLLENLAKDKPVYPPLNALYISRHRAREKEFVTSLGIRTPKFIVAGSFSDLVEKTKESDFPTVIKTCSEGYDGKGQWRFSSKTELENFSSTENLGPIDLVAEEMIKFDFEVSCVATRSIEGDISFYSMCENIHNHGILAQTKSPSSKVTSGLEKMAQEYTKKLLDSLSYVGTIAVEYFVRGEELLFNEFAPRVHNSGHWTIEGAKTSQFENHMRACCGMSLGSTENIGYSLMLNLLGTKGNVDAISKIPNAHYHWYDKDGLGDLRKVGHVTFVFDSEAERDAFDFSLLL